MRDPRSTRPALLALLRLARLRRRRPAPASVTWVVTGDGFGHGVGMSQYGAYGYAKHGKGYRFILGHYYRGTTIGDAARAARRPRPARRSPPATSASAARPAPAAARSTRPRNYQAHRGRRRGRLRSAGGKPLANCGRKLRAAGNGQDRDRRHRHLPRRARGRADRQRRRLAQRRQRARRRPVRQGRDPQRVAALLAAGGAAGAGGRRRAPSPSPPGRRQRLRPLRRHPQPGLRGARQRDRAHQRGRRRDPGPGRRCTSGKIAETYFSACSGGHTESVQNVFFGPPIPYLVGVPDPYDDYCPLHSWTLEFSGPEISSRLGAYLDGRLKRSSITKRGVSPRIVWAQLVRHRRRDQGQRRPARRSALGGYDTWMTFRQGRPAGLPKSGALSRPGRAGSGCRGRSRASRSS